MKFYTIIAFQAHIVIIKSLYTCHYQLSLKMLLLILNDVMCQYRIKRLLNMLWTV